MSRISVEESNRHVRVEVDGVTVAESTRPRILRERGLRPRYYLPAEDVRAELLVPTDSSTSCPFKGAARYWSLQLGERTYPDVVWSYPTPIEDRTDIAGLLCFYDEKVDLFVDGEKQ